MKVLACIVLALAVCAFADDSQQKDKRATFGLGYGAYPYSYGSYPYFGGYGAYPYAAVKGYGAYPYATPYYGSQLAYTAVVPAKTEEKDAVATKTVPASTVLPYSTFGAYPYSAYPYSGYPYSVGAYAGYPYNYGYAGLGYGFAGKLIK
ncbi:shematrin-like protein 1 [Hetaerina americana]|uniref:shematrin-like protein 1 n=1 Tax=Hetaerina americana TaxID=62018 RepID=UPI003A7F5DE2